MTKSLKLMTSLLALLLCADSFAQSVVVKGKVVDEVGIPLIAVAVYEPGNMSGGTITDFEGNYSIKLSSDQASLQFSCMGFVDVLEAVNGRTVINVTLKEESLSLSEAVVVSVGYGTVAKRDLTGSVSQVDTKELMKSPAVNFDQALTGKVAGVVVTTADGAVGSEATITIRGNNSLTQSSAPLYVVDGFPTESSVATNISSADIESIDILKDASATAIYGARGANGVIVITTKQGMEGKPKINFSASWSGSKIANKVDLMDAYDFVALQSEMYDYFGATNIYLRNPQGDPYTIEDYRNAKTYDWQDMIYRNAFTQNYSTSVSGGSMEAGNRYNVSFSATDQDGIIQKSNFQRYQGKLNFQQKIGKSVTFDLIANYSRSITNGVTPTNAQQSSSASGWLMYSVWGYRPTVPLAQIGDESIIDNIVDTEFATSGDYRFNPAKTVRNEYRKTTVDYLNANGALTWEIIEDLKLKVTGAYTMNKRTREEFNGTETYTGYPGSPSGKGVNGGIYWTDKLSWLNENTLTYTKRFQRKHNFQFLAGFTMQGETSSYQGTAAIQIPTEALGLNGLYAGKLQSVPSYQYDWTMMSGLFRVNYNYKYRYYLTASFRADGSSKFPTANRWGFFPSIGASWNINREEALKDLEWLNNAKLRFSWGQTGNNRTTTPYDFYSQITTLPGNQYSYDYVFNGQIMTGYFPSNMTNEKLKWETTEQWNLGLDFSVFKERVKVTADWYLKNTRDLLLQATIPASSGYTSAMMNVGSMQNKGVEFTLSLVPIQTKDFSWNFDFNIALNRNKVIALSNDQLSLFPKVSWDFDYNSQYPYITQVGKPSGLMYGFIYEGTYKQEDFTGDILSQGIPSMSSTGRELVRPGDPKYKDINKDGIIDDNDRTIIGCGQPLHTGGLGSTFKYKAFDLYLFFSWSYGNDILNANRLIFENGRKAGFNMFSSYSSHYSEANPDSDMPRIGANDMTVYSSRVVEDGSFLRLKTLSLAYTFQRDILRRLHFDSMRVYVSAENLFTFTNYSGPDPEVSTRNSVLTPGFDWSAYPRSRAITAGLTFTF